VFETFAPRSTFLTAMPDGEGRTARHWISRIHYQVLAAPPSSRCSRIAPPTTGSSAISATTIRTAGSFKVRDGVERVRFGDPGWRLGFRARRRQFVFVFQILREKRRVARHLRFQVSMPMVNSALPPRVFPGRRRLDKIKPGFEGGRCRGGRQDGDEIPAKRSRHPMGLCDEAQDVYGAIAQLPPTAALASEASGQRGDSMVRAPDTRP